MKFQDLKTLSKEYSISIFTFRKFVKMGLPHYRLGRKILVNPEDFEEWFEKFKTTEDTVEVMRELKDRISAYSPQAFGYIEPEQMAGNYRDILWRYIL